MAMKHAGGHLEESEGTHTPLNGIYANLHRKKINKGIARPMEDIPVTLKEVF